MRSVTAHHGAQSAVLLEVRPQFVLRHVVFNAGDEQGSDVPVRRRLNVLWFVALVLSLTSASIGMLVKQWLREYLNNPYVTPEERRRARLFRIRGLRKYKVSEIAAFLPLLLQMSLVLFFVGLVLFTQGINDSLGWVITGLVVVWLGFLVVTTSLPWFSSSCPYKTPFLKPVTTQFKRLLEYLYQISRRMW